MLSLTYDRIVARHLSQRVTGGAGADRLESRLRCVLSLDRIPLRLGGGLFPSLLGAKCLDPDQRPIAILLRRTKKMPALRGHLGKDSSEPLNQRFSVMLLMPFATPTQKNLTSTRRRPEREHVGVRSASGYSDR